MRTAVLVVEDPSESAACLEAHSRALRRLVLEYSVPKYSVLAVLSFRRIRRRYLSGPARKSRTSRTLSSSSYSTARTGTLSNDTIVAPGYASRIGECVAMMNCASCATMSAIIAISPSWLCGLSGASGSSSR